LIAVPLTDFLSPSVEHATDIDCIQSAKQPASQAHDHSLSHSRRTRSPSAFRPINGQCHIISRSVPAFAFLTLSAGPNIPSGTDGPKQTMFKEDQPSNQSRTRCTQSKEDNVNEPTDEETDSILHARYEKNEHTSKGFKGLMGVTTTQKSDLSRWHSPCRVSTKSAKERDIDRQTDRQTDRQKAKEKETNSHPSINRTMSGFACTSPFVFFRFPSGVHGRDLLFLSLSRAPATFFSTSLHESSPSPAGQTFRGPPPSLALNFLQLSGAFHLHQNTWRKSRSGNVSCSSLSSQRQRGTCRQETILVCLWNLPVCGGGRGGGVTHGN